MKEVIKIDVYVSGADAYIKDTGEVVMTKLANESVDDFMDHVKIKYPDYSVKIGTKVLKMPEFKLEDKPVNDTFIQGFVQGYKDAADNTLFSIFGKRIKEKDYPKLRKRMIAMNISNTAVSITAGVVLGKSVLTGVAIGASVFIVNSIATKSVLNYNVKQLNK